MDTSSKKVIYAALIGNSLVALTKFIAAFMTGSSAMLSEGIHSVVDTGNQVLLLLGLSRAKKPPDEKFPFGHGKEIYFWAFIVAILLFAIGSGISIYEGIKHLISPRPIVNPMINYVVLGIACVFEGGALYVAVKEFSIVKGKRSYVEAVKGSKDPSIFVVLFEDSAALLGLIVAFVGILLADVTGILYFDGIASVLIGLILGGTATWLAYETKGLLIGEAAEPEIIESIRALAGSIPEVVHLNEALTMHMGPDYILVTLSLDFKDDIPAGTVERIVARLDADIKAAHPKVKRVFVEAEDRSTTLRDHSEAIEPNTP